MIEDDAHFAAILVSKCHEKGFKCLAAPTGEAGLELAERYLPSAVILDLRLPGMDGLAVLGALKENTRSRHIPVHVVSAAVSCAAVVIGGSFGGLEALEAILRGLPADFAPPLLVVEHLHPTDAGAFAEYLAGIASMPVVEPCDKLRMQPGHLYAAPANYHMLVELDRTISLSVDERVNCSRPSIDVLFESAAQVWGAQLVAVLLSGANADGRSGLRAVKVGGGRTIAQDPAGAYARAMPLAAIEAGVVDEVLAPGAIATRLVGLAADGGLRS